MLAVVLAQAITTISESGKKLKRASAATVTALTKDGVGTLKVKHYFGENVKMHINVSLDRENLGNALATIDISGKDDKQQYIAVNQTATVERKKK